MTTFSPKSSERQLTQINATTQPRRKGKRTKAVIHQIFEDASKETQDRFWANMLEDAARGVFPSKKFNYSRGKLIYYTTRKSDFVPIPTVPREAFKVFYDFIRLYSTLASDNDIQGMKIDMEISLRSNQKNITNKDIWPMLHHFIYNFSTYYNISPKMKRSLEDTVKIGYRLGIFTNHTVVIENNIIINLPGMVVDQQNDICFLDQNALLSARDRIFKENSKDKILDPKTIVHEMYLPRGKCLNEDWKRIAVYMDAVTVAAASVTLSPFTLTNTENNNDFCY